MSDVLMSMGVRKLLLSSLFLCFSMTPILVAVEPTCAKLAAQEGQLGYQARGNRCEGLFVAETGSVVRLKGFLTNHNATTSLDAGSLQVAIAPGVPRAEYHLRLESRDPRVHYQLDAAIPNDGKFLWPASDVVLPAGIDPALLVPLSWVDSDPRYFVPVSYSGTAVVDHPADRRIHVLIESTAPIERFVARLTDPRSNESIELSSTSQLPATWLDLEIPSTGSPGLHKLWLRVLVLGESKTEPQSWMIWLP